MELRPCGTEASLALISTPLSATWMYLRRYFPEVSNVVQVIAHLVSKNSSVIRHTDCALIKFGFRKLEVLKVLGFLSVEEC